MYMYIFRLLKVSVLLTHHHTQISGHLSQSALHTLLHLFRLHVDFWEKKEVFEL